MCMPAESPSILIVDDEEAALTICKHLLQKMGYNVLGAKNSGDAYQIAKKNRGTIAVAILDYSLPSIENESVPKRLSEIDPALKIMLTSGYCEFGTISDLVQESDYEFIQKPFNRAQLDEKLKTILS
jgi:two-component system, cell cycle sensor histidine kinase and response regulator CckA